MNQIIIHTNPVQDEQHDAIVEQNYDNTWLNYFRPEEAFKDFLADVANMPSSKNPEKHTWKVYGDGLNYWFKKVGHAMPTKSLVNRYITHLRHEKEWGNGKKGLSVSTVGSKYLAPLRKYMDFLAGQHIETRVDGSPLTNQDRHFIMDAREQIRAAIDVKTPKPEVTTNQSALYAHGERLTLNQVQQLYNTCDVNTLAGLRDFAILYIGFTTGMRIAEIRRITLGKIKQAESCYLIHVRRKRGNHDPISLDATGFALIHKWAERYNATLQADDPRRIDSDTPLWQAVQHNDTPFPLNYKGQGEKMRNRGMSAESIRHMLKKRARIANAGSLTEFPKFTPHDMRRTVAAIAAEGGMDLTLIQGILGHKSLATTGRYIGKPQRPEKMLITNLPGIRWTIPEIPQIMKQQELSESA
jgi:site-specific recombinase XerD